MGLQLSPQPDAVGHHGKPQRLPEKRILAEGFDGFKVALAQSNKGDESFHDS